MQLGRRIGRSGMTKPAHWRLPSSLLYPSHALRCTPHNSLVPALYPSRRANLPVVLCPAPYTRVLASFSHARRPNLWTAGLSSRLTSPWLPTNPLLYTFPTNVGTPTCPAFWLRLSRLSLSTLFPEKNTSITSVNTTFISVYDDPRPALSLVILSATKAGVRQFTELL